MSSCVSPVTEVEDLNPLQPGLVLPHSPAPRLAAETLGGGSARRQISQGPPCPKREDGPLSVGEGVGRGIPQTLRGEEKLAQLWRTGSTYQCLARTVKRASALLGTLPADEHTHDCQTTRQTTGGETAAQPTGTSARDGPQAHNRAAASYQRSRGGKGRAAACSHPGTRAHPTARLVKKAAPEGRRLCNSTGIEFKTRETALRSCRSPQRVSLAGRDRGPRRGYLQLRLGPRVCSIPQHPAPALGCAACVPFQARVC